MPQELPQPGTSTEMYLAAILDELRGMRADAARLEPPEGTVELREPARSYLTTLDEPPKAQRARRKG